MLPTGQSAGLGRSPLRLACPGAGAPPPPKKGEKKKFGLGGDGRGGGGAASVGSKGSAGSAAGANPLLAMQEGFGVELVYEGEEEKGLRKVELPPHLPEQVRRQFFCPLESALSPFFSFSPLRTPPPLFFFALPSDPNTHANSALRGPSCRGWTLWLP